MNRYRKLFDVVNELQPKHIVEIGTWAGKRAMEWMGATNCFYTGFDLFEEASKETDEAELNVKRHFELTEVAQTLNRAGLSRFMLIRGNTRETLPQWIDKIEPFDFAFIDGGHSVETIKSDFEYIKKGISPGGTIILDDYYTPALEGFGCNFIEGEVFGPKDSFTRGHVQLMKVEMNG